ncbi:glycosyltransferase [Sphingobacterium sp. LRF_L2]|uniref:glycosyltransferase n=1 Tax=Sphingobacterium sp. LRF_L2 TaxID=3369421 RepID=UPI003F61E386
MKILHVGQMIGGLGVYIKNSIIYNNNISNNYIIVKGDKDGDNPIVKGGQAVKEFRIRLYRSINPFYDSIAIFQLIKIILKERPDIIHCHSAKGGIIGRIAGFLTRTITLYTPHAFSFLAGTGIKRKMFIFFERVTKLKAKLLACSASELDLGIEVVGYKVENAYLWSNSVPDACADKSSNKLSSEQLEYVCYIGRPSYQKNTFFYIEVIKRVIVHYPNLKFYLLGVGYHSPDLEHLKRKVSEYNLEEIVILKPWLSQQETFEYLKNALFYVTVSRYEGLPLSVIEAMSLSKAIVASKVYGNVDCVQNGENGFLAPLEVDCFVDHIKHLLSDRILLEGMANKSRTIFLNKFEITRQIKLLDNIYHSFK